MNPDRADLPPVIEAMLVPGFFPHAVHEPIDVIQTHISYVVLTGLFAYKVKKDVRLPFLDFSTLEARRHFVAEELRLNRAFAPELYIGTLPITMDGSGYRLDGEGEPVEWVLKMREFPGDSLWSKRFERDELTLTDMLRLGTRLAELHEAADHDAEIARFGDPDRVARVAEDNFTETEQFVGTIQEPSMLARTRALTRDFIATHRDLLIARQREGRIRACHGDLHLRNVCTLDGEVCLFDCIEFNAEFRNIDTLYDVAFMVVDLEYRNRPDLAYAFLNAYLERSGDYRGAALLPLYASMRAYVRAKVYSFQAIDSHLPERERAAAEEKARAFYTLAWCYTRSRSPEIWVVCGLSGSGKSTVGAWLAQQLGAVHLRSDAIRKHAAGVPLDARAPKRVYSRARSKETYAAMTDIALFLAGFGLPVVMDAKFDRYADREELRALIGAKGIALRMVSCEAPQSLLRYRIARRRSDVSDANLEVLERQLRHGMEWRDHEAVFTLDTARDWRRQMEEELEPHPLLCE